MEDCVEDVEIIKLLIPLKRALCHSRIKGISIIRKVPYSPIQSIFHPKYFETYYIVVFNFSDQGTSRQTENFRNYLTEMSGKGSSTLNCDICNTKFGFLTRKVIERIRNWIDIFWIVNWFTMSRCRHIFISIFRNHARNANCISAQVASNRWHLKRFPTPDTTMEVRDYWKSVQGTNNVLHTHCFIRMFFN